MGNGSRLTIRIRATRLAQADVYEVDASGDPGDRHVVGTYRTTDLPDDLVASAIGAIEGGTLERDQAVEFGQTLFNTLIKGDIREVYEDLMLPRIRLTVDLPQAQHIPWELMHDGERFLAARLPFSRGVSEKGRAASLTAELPLRVLVVDSYPDGVQRLNNELEIAMIDQALADLVEEGKASVTRVRGTVGAVANALREAGRGEDPRPFHVLHFIGHGEFSVPEGRDTPEPPRPRPTLLFEDEIEPEEGRRPPPLPVDAVGLLNIITNDVDADTEQDIKLVFLNACRSAQPTPYATAAGFAPHLLKAGIPAVIGMQTPVAEDAALTFATKFYRALADGVPVDAALEGARGEAATEAPDLVADIAVPVLYMRSDHGRLFELPPPPPTEPPPVPAGLIARLRWAFDAATGKTPAPVWMRSLLWLVGVVASTLVGMAVVAGWDWLRSDRTMPTDDINVAIAEFDRAGGIDREIAQSLSSGLFESLEPNLAEIPGTTTWGPDQTGRIRGATAEEREESAGRRADDINADIVVYGRLETAPSGRVELVPEFYINDRQASFTRAGAAELTGGYVLGQGDVVDPSDPVSANDEFAAAMQGRAAAIAQFVRGLAIYSRPAPDYSAALREFRAAEGIDQWREEEGREILHMFIGNAAGQLALRQEPGPGRLDALEEAGDAYQKSLDINPEYGRAWLGVAEVHLHLAGSCLDVSDPAELELAAEGFEAAKAAGDKPEHAAIDLKADFGLARVYMCRQINDLSPGGDPEATFESVIAAYEDGNEGIKDLAAESHGFLGLLAWRIDHDCERAVDEYEEAIGLLEGLAAEAERREALNGALNDLRAAIQNPSPGPWGCTVDA